jgi:hypothetical protein
MNLTGVGEGITHLHGVGLELRVVLGGEQRLHRLRKRISSGCISSGAINKGPTCFRSSTSGPAILSLRNFAAQFV